MARLHGSRRTVRLPRVRYRPRAGDGLETVSQGAADGQPLLVLLGHAAAGFPGLAAAQPRRQPRAVARSGVQHLYLVHGQLQPATLQRRDGVELFHPAVRHHALPVRHRSLRHGGHGRCHEGAGCQDHEDHRQLLGVPYQERNPYSDAVVARRGYPARHQRNPDVVRRQTDHHYARRPGAGHLAGPHSGHRAYQTTGHQRWRLFRHQLGTPARKPQCLYQHPRVLVDPDPSDGDGLRVRLLYAPP